MIRYELQISKVFGCAWYFWKESDWIVSPGNVETLFSTKIEDFFKRKIKETYQTTTAYTIAKIFKTLNKNKSF